LAHNLITTTLLGPPLLAKAMELLTTQRPHPRLQQSLPGVECWMSNNFRVQCVLNCN